MNSFEPQERLMSIVRFPQSARIVLLLGLLGLASGCGGGDPNSKAPAPPTTEEQQAAEREARQKAFGKMGIPGQPPKAAAKK